MVPDDEVSVAVVDLGEVRGLVPVEVSPAPLDVAPPTHQRRHRPLHRLVLGLARVLPTLALSLVVLGCLFLCQPFLFCLDTLSIW